ncbi:hypothetical protein EG329_007625 [Mollisiaceae sp. DMI_Dod_QoI]|nr:hypothetical protein EG329_007625 [Helotiales sp. DMI_Dod_QoI]
MEASLDTATWKREIIPSQKMGVKAGAPAIAQREASWLANFYRNCTDCKLDFILLHFYSDFKDFASYFGSVLWLI